MPIRHAFVGVKMLHADEYRVLEKTVASRKMAAGKVRRASIVLLSDRATPPSSWRRRCLRS